jgi:hypothetical protein
MTKRKYQMAIKGILDSIFKLSNNLVERYRKRGWMGVAMACDECGSVDPECNCGMTFICEKCHVRHDESFGCSDDQWRRCDSCYIDTDVEANQPGMASSYG